MAKPELGKRRPNPAVLKCRAKNQNRLPLISFGMFWNHTLNNQQVMFVAVVTVLNNLSIYIYMSVIKIKCFCLQWSTNMEFSQMFKQNSKPIIHYPDLCFPHVSSCSSTRETYACCRRTPERIWTANISSTCWRKPMHAATRRCGDMMRAHPVPLVKLVRWWTIGF